MAETIAYGDFERVDIRVGTIIDAQPFPEARKPAYQADHRLRRARSA